MPDMHDAADNPVPVQTRKKMFAELVALQDQGLNAMQSRHAIAKRFSVDVSVVRGVEEEGLREEWPPL